MRKIIAMVLLMVAGIVSSQSIDWQYNEYRDKMTGEVGERRVIGSSQNEIDGLGYGQVGMIVTCDSNIWLYGASFGGFDRKDAKTMRARIDDGDVFNTHWTISDDFDQAYMVDTRREQETIGLLLHADTFYLEVQPAFGDEDVAEFDMDGFSDALLECPPGSSSLLG